MKTFKSILLLGLCFAHSLLLAQSLTPEQAYAAIPHARTEFKVDQSKLAPKQREALKQLFDLCDQGVVLRVEAMRAFQANDKVQLQRHVQSYSTLIKRVQELPVPSELQSFQALLVPALQDHQRFYVNKLQDIGRHPWALGAEAHQASQKLHQAYAHLLQTYPQEGGMNRQAFFDYLCALDFL